MPPPTNDQTQAHCSASRATTNFAAFVRRNNSALRSRIFFTCRARMNCFNPPELLRLAVALGDQMWQPAFTLVNGKLTRRVLEEATPREAWVGTLDIFAATQLQTAKAGPVKLKLKAAAGEAWIDSRKIGGTGESVAELSAGTHRVLVRMDPKKIPESISLKSSDGAFSAN
jgi:hypothetical protein